ncbi:MAG TPA: ABC transporter substrate-binding protein [Acidimicrobiales bacterium]|nr:ABC transporter substrate-binding protein [Acidimicrobiales bacterium]
MNTRVTPGVGNRLLRGYGPVGALAVLLLLMSVLVPSKAESDGATDLTAGFQAGQGSAPGESSSGSGASRPGSGTGSSDGATGGASGGGESGGGGGTGVPAQAGGCPDRQEQVPGDPYSPPCVAFEGDNGGETTKGVNAEEILVSFRVLNEKGFQQTLAELAGASLVDKPADIKRTVEAFAEYFNQRFELYGRQIKIAFYDGVGSNTTELLGGGRDKAEADAVRVAEEIGAFADLSATSEPYADALARRGVVAFGTPYLSKNWHAQRAPFAWSLATDGTTVAALAAEYAALRLADKPAVHAGGALKDKPRKFATLAPENSWYQESVEFARQVVTDAGKDPGVNIKYQLDLGTMSNQAANIIPKMKSEGVTTMLCGCDPIMPVFLSGVANRESYYPEFIVTGTALTDTDIVGQLWNQEFAKHAFGVSSMTEPVPPTETIAYEAYKTVRQDEPAFSVDLIYYQMYMLAIGLQGAGPNLTPESFANGMFSYPPKNGPVGLWKFGPDDFTAANDVREIYWDPSAISNYNGKQGAYVDPAPGTRWEAGNTPTGDPAVPVR